MWYIRADFGMMGTQDLDPDLADVCWRTMSFQDKRPRLVRQTLPKLLKHGVHVDVILTGQLEEVQAE